MDHQTKRTVCRMIAGLVSTDGEFSDAERSFLDKVLTEFEIPESEWDAIFPLLEFDEATDAIAALASPVQQTAFSLLLEAARADGVVAPEEVTYLEAVGEAMGMDAAELEARLRS
jgi:uncharacterized tellurite resistance protein B-like protein